MRALSVLRRLRFIFLLTLDRVFNTRFVERETARLRDDLASFEAQASQLQGQMSELDQLMRLLHIQICMLCLRQRQLQRPDDWLHFDLSAEGEEKELDLLIEHLVKQSLAAVTTVSKKDSGYVYKLDPNWAQIERMLHGKRDEQAIDSVTKAWLSERREEV